MGQIVGAALVSHVPPIVLPAEERLELNNGVDFSLVDGLHRLRAEQLDRVRPDTIIVFDTHWYTTFEHIVTAHARRSGRYTSDELPRGNPAMPYDLPGDPELAARDRGAGRGTRRHVRPRNRRSVHRDPLPHAVPHPVPPGRRGVDQRRCLPDGDDRRLPALRSSSSRKPSRRSIAPSCCWPAGGSRTGSGRCGRYATTRRQQSRTSSLRRRPPPTKP